MGNNSLTVFELEFLSDYSVIQHSDDSISNFQMQPSINLSCNSFSFPKWTIYSLMVFPLYWRCGASTENLHFIWPLKLIQVSERVTNSIQSPGKKESKAPKDENCCMLIKSNTSWIVVIFLDDALPMQRKILSAAFWKNFLLSWIKEGEISFSSVWRAEKGSILSETSFPPFVARASLVSLLSRNGNDSFSRNDKWWNLGCNRPQDKIYAHGGHCWIENKTREQSGMRRNIYRRSSLHRNLRCDPGRGGYTYGMVGNDIKWRTEKLSKLEKGE